MQFVYTGNDAEAILLIKNGVDINTADVNGTFPIFLAAEKGLNKFIA